MKALLILRHAKSSWKEPLLADYDRPLNKRGKHDTPRVDQFLREHGLVPDRIISSTAKRARKTAQAVTKAGDHDVTPEFFHAGLAAYIAILRDVSDDYQRIMVVGHNPGLEELVTELTGLAEIMPTVAVAHISLPIEQWKDLANSVKGELINLWRPKELAQ